MPRTVGLTGATGHIGGLLLRRLLSEPGTEEIRSVARRALPDLGELPPGAPRLAHTCAELRSGAARDALAGCDLVYHLAAQVWRGRGPAALSDMAAVNVEGTRNVVTGATAVVMASSASVYGAWPDNPLPMDEAHPPRPNPECPYAQQKLQAEAVCAGSAQAYVVLRLSAVLGPHADTRVSRAVRGYRLAVPAARGIQQAVQWMDEEDAVDALLAAGRALGDGGKGVDGEVVNVAPADWLSAGEVARLAHSRTLPLPRSALVSLAELGRRARLSPFGADRAVLVSGPLALATGKAAERLGWRARKSSAQVMREALDRNWRGGPENRQA